MGAFEIRTSATLNNDEKIIGIYFKFDEDGDLKLTASYVTTFTIEESIASVNILRLVYDIHSIYIEDISSLYSLESGVDFVFLMIL